MVWRFWRRGTPQMGILWNPETFPKQFVQNPAHTPQVRGISGFLS